ncbi:uncharacterized protein LOC131650208 [Vicia villosa]|uniref:uncharacterized protein LOC131650208 n=1 Tax=Vicia villosa TaxID=3911 RepID=UPI00273CDDDB|nr:uncharacterized protein LOC131650208 [Vicia villosa]
MDVKLIDVHVDVYKQLTNEHEFVVREHMLKWICTEAAKLGFGVVTGRSGNGPDRRQTFVTLICERSGEYTNLIQKLKQNYTGSNRCECPFKLCGYFMANNTWTFNVICGRHNYDMCYKLDDHLIVYCLNLEENELVSNMKINMVQSKNIFATLKRRIP